MEILILLKNNIRYRKGTFISIVFLMLIISMSVTAISSIRDNCIGGIDEAHIEQNSGDLLSFISDRRLNDSLYDSVKEHEMVEKVVDYHSVCSDKSTINGVENNNSWMLLKLRDGVKLYNRELTAYEKETPELERGEIYIPQGIILNQECSVGDTVTLSTIGGEYDFKIKGIVLEPYLGASVIGWKMVYINDEDFDMLFSDAKKAETEEMTADVHVLQIYKSSDCKLSDAQFKRQLNLDTGIVDNSFGSIAKEMSIHYTKLFPTIICSILMLFIGLLLIVVLIVLWHSVSTGIEMDYVNLETLKSQGFDNGRIRILFILQYALAQFIGAVFGTCFAIPLIKGLGNVFQPIIAILITPHVSLVKSLLFLLAFLIISSCFVLVITRKVGKISPVTAISGAHREIYFDSRLRMPICSKALLTSLALRQFTSKKRSYVGMLTIVSILVFFMMTITVLGNVMNSKSAVESMGMIYTECDVKLKETLNKQQREQIEKTIEQYSPILKKYYMSSIYYSLNGEETACEVYQNPEAIYTLKGRAPLYDNEIVITSIIADELNLKMGDEVTISHQNKKEKYLISGIYQNMRDTGRCFAMSVEGSKKMGVEYISYAGYNLKLPEKAEEIVSALNDKYSDLLEAKVIDQSVDETYNIAINAMKAVIYCFSVVFALTVVLMICTKAFIQEKTDIGIYKSLGFTAAKLRLQFAIRFLIVSVIGSLFGNVLCLLFSGRLLTMLLTDIGISSFVVCYTPFTFIAPTVLICFSFFLFAYLAAGKIKKVQVRELIIE